MVAEKSSIQVNSGGLLCVLCDRYGAESRLEKLESAMVLGEHTGGSAVRAVTLVTLKQINQPHTAQNTVKERTQDPLLLLSVGAKEVLTCWLLEWGNDSDSKNASIDKGNSITTRSTSHGIVDPIEEIPVEQSLSSKWLTSYTPPRTSHPSKSKEITPDPNNVQDSIQNRSEKPNSEGSRRGVKEDDDLRFLAVTAFSVCCTVTGCEPSPHYLVYFYFYFYNVLHFCTTINLSHLKCRSPFFFYSIL